MYINLVDTLNSIELEFTHDKSTATKQIYRWKYERPNHVKKVAQRDQLRNFTLIEYKV